MIKAEKQVQSMRVCGRPSPYKMVWLFTIGCLAGCALETVFTYFNKGYLESRRGMVIGPFNQVYGFGILVMVHMLTPLTRRRNGVLFLGGAAVGGLFEAASGLVQEHVLGTRSWDYSGERAALLGGHTSLLLMFYWGILGMALMRWVYPFLSQMIDRVPRREGYVFARLMAGFLAVNMLLSLAAVVRWNERRNGVRPRNALEESLDIHFPDERLARIYPTMTVVSASQRP